MSSVLVFIGDRKLEFFCECSKLQKMSMVICSDYSRDELSQKFSIAKNFPSTFPGIFTNIFKHKIIPVYSTDCHWKLMFLLSFSQDGLTTKTLVVMRYNELICHMARYRHMKSLLQNRKFWRSFNFGFWEFLVNRKNWARKYFFVQLMVYKLAARNRKIHFCKIISQTKT